MERSIRIGKDFNVLWSIYKVEDGERQPYELAGKELVLRYRTPSGRYIDATEWAAEGNVIMWTFRGKDQKVVGSYELILTENAGKDGMVTVDTRKAFRLVEHSCEETEGRDGEVVIRTVTLESEIALAPAGSGGSAQTMTPVLYDELVQLRNDGQLVPGTYYRITDYVTTTAQANTRSAGHPFDVIVLALTSTELSEEAFAVHSERDTDGYFSGSRLNTWKLWYSLDNDRTRFAWADDIRAIRVHMENEDEAEIYIYVRYPAADTDLCAWAYLDHVSAHGEFHEVYNWDQLDSADLIYTGPSPAIGDYVLMGDVPARLMEIKRPGTGVIYRMIDEFDNDCPYDFKNIQYKRRINIEEGYPQFSEDAEEHWVYTFAATSHHVDRDEWSELKDGSLEPPYGHQSDGDTSTFRDNVIEPWVVLYDPDEDPRKCGKAYLNNNVLLGYWAEFGSDSDEFAYNYAVCCYDNRFGPDSRDNTLGTGCNHNAFGLGYRSNVLGPDCARNNFGHSCFLITFGRYCCDNTFGNFCSAVQFGEQCAFNRFGSCAYIEFRDQDGPADNLQYNQLEDGVDNITGWYNDNKGTYGSLRYHHICRGVNNARIALYADRACETTYARKSDGSVVEFVLADLTAS